MSLCMLFPVQLPLFHLHLLHFAIRVWDKKVIATFLKVTPTETKKSVWDKREGFSPTLLLTHKKMFLAKNEEMQNSNKEEYINIKKNIFTCQKGELLYYFHFFNIETWLEKALYIPFPIILATSFSTLIIKGIEKMEEF